MWKDGLWLPSMGPAWYLRAAEGRAPPFVVCACACKGPITRGALDKGHVLQDDKGSKLQLIQSHVDFSVMSYYVTFYLLNDQPLFVLFEIPFKFSEPVFSTPSVS